MKIKCHIYTVTAVSFLLLLWFNDKSLNPYSMQSLMLEYSYVINLEKKKKIGTTAPDIFEYYYHLIVKRKENKNDGFLDNVLWENIRDILLEINVNLHTYYLPIKQKIKD